MTALTFVDLYAGAGLFSAGLVEAGLVPVRAVELSSDAVASYRRNVAPCIVKGSVSDLITSPKADVLVAGPPCQGFSTLGRRDPTDARNEMSLHILPWIVATEPHVVVVENVPPFLRSPQWLRLHDALLALRYPDIATWELDAFDFGTPQRRRRAFTIASRGGAVTAPRPGERRLTAGSALFAPGLDLSDPMHTWPIKTGIAAARISLVPSRGDKRDLLRAHPELCPPSWAKIGGSATDVYGRIDPDQPSNTVRCEFQNPSKGRYIHPYEDRVLSLREGARLQGVPDHWIFEGKPYPVARQIGNGVPLQLGHAIGRAIADHFFGAQTIPALAA